MNSGQQGVLDPVENLARGLTTSGPAFFRSFDYCGAGAVGRARICRLSAALIKIYYYIEVDC